MPSKPKTEKFIENNILQLFLNASEVIKPQPSEKIVDLLNQRNEARKEKDWKKSDQLRDSIIAMGWDIQDTPEGSVLIKK